MFPNENDVSKRQCFQCMFPIYMEPEFSVSILEPNVWVALKRSRLTELL